MNARDLTLPTLRLYNRQVVHRPNLPWLRRVAKAALPLCREAARSSLAPLIALREVEITFVTDAEITLVHGEFMADPTPTDVITFHHGEILISTDTALRQAADHGETLDRELALYIVHGLLHLAGWEDLDPQDAARMAERQFAILATAISKVPTRP